MNQKPLALMTTIVSLLLLGFVGNGSDAFQINTIESLDGTYTYYYGGYTNHVAHVETDEPYSWVPIG